MKKTLSVLALSCMLSAAPLVAQAQEWATLKAKIVYDGPIPTRVKVDSSKDAFCAKLDIVSEAMVVGKGGELANLALIMDPRKSKVDAIHPDLAEPSAEPVVLDNDGCIFKPHVFVARAGQTVKVKNSDQTGHNAKFDFFSNESRNDLIPVGGSIEFKLESAERASANPVECNIHPWMKSYIIVRDHPYVGVSGEDGVIEIKNLPAGEVTFRLWHENQDGAIDKGEVGGKAQKWSRGYMEVDLKPGMNDLGTIKIPAAAFNK